MAKEQTEEQRQNVRAQAGMSVADLIKKLQTLPPETAIWVEHAGEHRPLEESAFSAVSSEHSIYDNDEGGILDEYTVPVVIIGTWD